MPLSGNYDAASQLPKYAVAGGEVDKRYVYATNQGWTERHFEASDGSKYYDEVLEAKTLYTDSNLNTLVTRAINGSGAGYPSIGGAYAVVIKTAGSGYTAGTKAVTGGSGSNLTVTITASAITSGIIATVDTIGAADPLRTAGTYTIGASDYTTELAGTGATFSVVVDGSGAAAITVVSGGSGYVVDETITIADANLGGGGGADLTFDVATVSSTGGAITSAVIATYGAGYADAETVTVAGGTGGTLTVRV
jgi:hypothetical protein